MRSMASIRATLSQLSRLFLAASCPLCQRSAADVLCSSCHHQLMDAHRSAQQHRFVKNHRANNRCLTISQSNQDAVDVIAWGDYQGALKQALSLLKYGNQAELGVWLGMQLGRYWQQLHGASACQTAVVVPIPLHRQRQQQRGYNQAALIARGLCRVAGLSLAEHGLVRTKATQAMYSLGLQQRQTNLKQAFSLGKGLPPTSRPVVLVDDIYTTGTTVLAATEVLRQAGYQILCIVTVARTRSQKTCKTL